MRKQMFLAANPLIFENAAKNRYAPTNSERLLWELLLRHRPMGYKFRRQHPLGIFIADFYCHQVKLVIELDGSVHDLPEVAKHDKERQQWLEDQGLSVLRMDNAMVEKSFPVAKQLIEDWIISLAQNKVPPAPLQQYSNNNKVAPIPPSGG